MIEVSGIHKQFRLYRNPSDRLKELFFRKKYHTDFVALDDISFKVESGETLGIIGQNGAGKSTLLKILTGVLIPDRGEVDLDGKITGLLELGTGFNPDMTGLQNIYLNGAFLGMTSEELDERKDDIIAFTELGEFIHEPLKTYSSGMTMRLAFSIAIHANPRCFVVDEALSVGDAYFQQKCMRAIKSFRDSGGSIIFVSHDMNAIKVLCDRALLLERGRVIEEGEPERVVNKYNYILALREEGEDLQYETGAGCDSFGTMTARISSVDMIGESEQSGMYVSGERCRLRVELESQDDIDQLTVGILIRDRFGQDIFGTNTFHHEIPLSITSGGKLAVEFAMPLNIGTGKYTITAALHSERVHMEQCYHWADRVFEFEVAGVRGAPSIGVCRLEPEIRVLK